MRILHTISTLAPSSGGPTEVLKHLVWAQAAAGHVVTVCTTDRGNPVHERLTDSYFESVGGKSVTLKVFPVLYAPLLFSPALASWSRAAVREFDIVHIHGLYRFPPTYVAWEARRQGIPYVIRPHGALDPYLYRKSSRNLQLKRLYERLFDLPNLNGASAIHYTAVDERERTRELQLRSPSFVVPNAVNWSHYAKLPARGRLRQRWGLPDHAPIVLFLGRLHFKKGLDLLIPAFDVLRTDLPEVQLVIAGPDTDGYGAKVRQWIGERGLQHCVHLVGPLTGEDVVQAYVDADVFALPSYTENFGVSVAEAMACAVPVVISDQVNIHPEVSAAQAGLVVKCDARELAGALLSVTRNPEIGRRMGKSGRELVGERYTWPVVAAALQAEYERLVRQRDPRTCDAVPLSSDSDENDFAADRCGSRRRVC